MKLQTFNEGLKQGHIVEARWRHRGQAFYALAKIRRINKHSVRVALVEAAFPLKAYRPLKGVVFTVPRITGSSWSLYHGVFPPNSSDAPTFQSLDVLEQLGVSIDD